MLVASDGKLAFMLGLLCDVSMRVSHNEYDSNDDDSDPPSGTNIPLPDFPVPPQPEFNTVPLTMEHPFSPVEHGIEGHDIGAGIDLYDCSDDSLFEIFTNGMGLVHETQGRFKLVTETASRHVTFLASMQWSLSSNIQALPFIWQKCRKGHAHHYADIWTSTSIVAKELGFNTAIDYMQCLGWTLKKAKGKVTFCNTTSCKMHVINRMALTKGSETCIATSWPWLIVCTECSTMRN
jgi:hypothetical protein